MGSQACSDIENFILDELGQTNDDQTNQKTSELKAKYMSDQQREEMLNRLYGPPRNSSRQERKEEKPVEKRLLKTTQIPILLKRKQDMPSPHFDIIASGTALNNLKKSGKIVL